MSKFRMLLFAVVGILASSMSVFAQAGAEAGDNFYSVTKYRAIAAGLGFAMAAPSASRASVRRHAKARRAIQARRVVSRR